MSPRKRKTSSVPVTTKEQNKTDLDQIKVLIENLPPQERLEAIELVRSTTLSHSGPLPAPQDFREYDQVLPGSAERILSMAEKEQQIRESDTNHFFRNQRWHIISAGFVALGLVVVSGIAAWHGNVAIALPLGLVGLGTLVARLIYEWKSRQQ